MKLTKDDVKLMLIKLRFTEKDDISQLGFKGHDTYTFHCPFCNKDFMNMSALPKEPHIVQCPNIGADCGMRTVQQAIKDENGKYRWVRRKDLEEEWFTHEELREIYRREQK